MKKYEKFFLDKCPCSKTSMDLNKDTCQGKTRTIFASVNYLSSALVKENLLYFSFTLPRRTCQGKTCQEELSTVVCTVGKFSLTSELVKENLLV